MATTDQPEDDVVLGISLAMRRVEAMIRKVSNQRVSVLVTGESGVGTGSQDDAFASNAL